MHMEVNEAILLSDGLYSSDLMKSNPEVRQTEECRDDIDCVVRCLIVEQEAQTIVKNTGGNN